MSIPVILDPDEALSWLLGLDREPTKYELETIMSRLGRVHGPWVLGEIYECGLLAPEAATPLVAAAWSAAEYPEDALDRECWLDLFGLAGYTVDGKPASRPSQALRLYRGAPEHLRDRMSWTESLDEARRFATGQLHGRLEGMLWTVEVDPWRLLAADTGRDEAEHVIDPHGLEIMRYRDGGAI